MIDDRVYGHLTVNEIQKILKDSEGSIKTVKQGWAWPACLFTWVWCLLHKLWWLGGLFFALGGLLNILNLETIGLLILATIILLIIVKLLRYALRNNDIRSVSQK